MMPRSPAFLLRIAICLAGIAGGGVVVGFLVHWFTASPTAIFLPSSPEAKIRAKSETYHPSSSSDYPRPQVTSFSAPISLAPSSIQPPAQAAPIRPSAPPPNAAASSGVDLLVQAMPDGQVSRPLAELVYRTDPHQALPVVLADLPEDLALTPQQAARLDAMAEEFTAAVGGPDQDPNDPAYKKRWQEAQWLFDQQVRANLGEEIFQAIQNHAYLQRIHSAASQ